MAQTQIVQRQIADGAINDAKVAAGANIASSKLADGANFLKKDGSVALTGNLNGGSQQATNFAPGSAGTDLVNLNQLNAAIANLNGLFKPKPSARAATTANINISNPGTAVFDTITLTVGQILFVRAQTATAEQGLYTFNGSSVALTRIPEMDAWTEIPAAFFAVEEGATYADTMWLCVANQGGTLGSTSITFQQIPTSSGLTNANFADKEIPSGSINGSNTAFVLSATPVAGSEHVYVNGILYESGAGNDYTISGANLTFAIAPNTGEKIRVSYRK